MKSRAEFARALATLNLSHVERAVAFLWYYRHTQQYEERSASELANDLHDEDFPRPNVTRLDDDLRHSPDTIRGKRPATFQIDVRQLSSLNQRYLPLLGARQAQVEGKILPPDMVARTRAYLEQLVHQINGAYEYGFFDACAVMCRRLMESLIIEVYIGLGRHHEIQQDGVFFSLEKLLAKVKADRTLALSRGAPRAMDEIKQLGDTGAHDRTYITTQTDIDDVKTRYRKLISELLELSKIRK